MASYDYRKIIKVFSTILKEQTDCKEFVLDQDIGEMPQYPFASYSFGKTHIKETVDIVDGEVFEVILQIMVHDIDYFNVLNLMESIEKALRSNKANRLFDENSIVLIDDDPSDIQDNPISIQVEHRAAITLRLRVQDDFKDDVPQIENINFN